MTPHLILGVIAIACFVLAALEVVLPWQKAVAIGLALFAGAMLFV